MPLPGAPGASAVLGGALRPRRRGRWAIAVGTIADSTTTVTSSENCVRSMMCAFNPYSELIVPNASPVLISSVVTSCSGTCRRASGSTSPTLGTSFAAARTASTPRFAKTAPRLTFIPPRRKKNGVRNAKATTRRRSCSPLVLAVVAAHDEPEHERGQDRVALRLVGEHHEREQAREHELDLGLDQATNDTVPMSSAVPSRSRKSSGSTSAPARKVSTMLVNRAMNTSHAPRHRRAGSVIRDWAMNDTGHLLLVVTRERHSPAGLSFRASAQVRAASGAWSVPLRVAAAAPSEVAIGPGTLAVVSLYPDRLASVDDTVRGVAGTWRAAG
jgi:hypothetical protein